MASNQDANQKTVAARVWDSHGCKCRSAADSCCQNDASGLVIGNRGRLIVQQSKMV